MTGLIFLKPQRRDEQASEEPLSTVLFQEGPLGIILGQDPQAGLVVRKFQKDGNDRMMQAEVSQKIAIGDVLHSINGRSVGLNLTAQEVSPAAVESEIMVRGTLTYWPVRAVDSVSCKARWRRSGDQWP